MLVNSIPQQLRGFLMSFLHLLICYSAGMVSKIISKIRSTLLKSSWFGTGWYSIWKNVQLFYGWRRALNWKNLVWILISPTATALLLTMSTPMRLYLAKVLAGTSAYDGIGRASISGDVILKISQSIKALEFYGYFH